MNNSDIDFSTVIPRHQKQHTTSHAVQERIDHACSYDFISTDRDVLDGLMDEHPLVRRHWLKRDDYIMTPEMIQIASMDDDPQNKHVLKDRLKFEKAYMNAGRTEEDILREKSWISLTLHSLNINPGDDVYVQRPAQRKPVSPPERRMARPLPSDTIHSQRMTNQTNENRLPNPNGPIRRKIKSAGMSH